MAENEVQKRRTFEILAKYVAQKNDVTIKFEPDAVHCDVKLKTITLPSNVKTENIYPALAWLMHEAAHIRHTTFEAKDIVTDSIDFNILNAVEDIRIDRKNFGLLPNVKGIYTEMVKFVSQRNKEVLKDAPIESKVLCDAILMAEEFGQHTSKSPEIAEFIEKTNLMGHINALASSLNSLECGARNTSDVKQRIKTIRDILVLSREQVQQPQPQQGQGQGKGKGKGNPTPKDKGNDKGQPQQGQGQGQQPQGQGNQDSGNNKDNKPADKDSLDLSAVERTTGGGLSKQIFGTLEKNPSNASALGTASLHERTRSDFKELLNIKERHYSNDGQQLDTDNLVAYFTGEIEDLFKDEQQIRRKKSKILILLDASGSMAERIFSNNDYKQNLLVETVKAVTDILDEVQMIDGLDVDYDVRAFDTQYKVLDKKSWSKDYLDHIGGGTNLSTAFEKAQKELLKDRTIEGKKIVLVVTDGEVDMTQLEQIKNDIIRNNADVRAMIIGIGSEPCGNFVKHISGHNILDKQYADAVLLEAISEMMT